MQTCLGTLIAIMMALPLAGPLPEGYEDAPQVDDIPDDTELVALEDLSDRDRSRALELEQQFLPRFHAIWVGEISFVDDVCDLNDQQRLLIRKHTAASPRTLLRRWVLIQMQMGYRGRVVAWRVQPHKLIRTAVGSMVHEQLRPDQLARYDAEVAKRQEHIKAVARQSIVAHLDKRLMLGVEQRADLERLLSTHWQDEWEKVLQMRVSRDRRLPGIPDRYVVPVLTDAQRMIWHETRKLSFSAALTIDQGPLPELANE